MFNLFRIVQDCFIYLFHSVYWADFICKQLISSSFHKYSIIQGQVIFNLLLNVGRYVVCLGCFILSLKDAADWYCLVYTRLCSCIVMAGRARFKALHTVKRTCGMVAIWKPHAREHRQSQPLSLSFFCLFLT